jgi:hypothetical protein
VCQLASAASSTLCPTLQPAGRQDVANYSFVFGVLHALLHVRTGECFVHEVHGSAPVRKFIGSDR